MVISTRHKIPRLMKTSGLHFYRDDRRPTEYNRICSEHIDCTLKSFVIKMIVSFSLASIGPAMGYFQCHELITLYEMRLPYSHANPENEFMVNVLWQGSVGSFSFACVIVFEGLTSNELETRQMASKMVNWRLKRLLVQIIYMDEYESNSIHSFIHFNLILI